MTFQDIADPTGIPVLSVVVPTNRWDEGLAARLARLGERGGLAPGQWEAIVVLSGLPREVAPPDGVIPVVRFLASATDLGRAGARNRGIAGARAPRILFLDSDCDPGDGLLAAHHREGLAHPDRALLGRVDFPADGVPCHDLAWDAASYFAELKPGEDYNFIKFITANLSVPAGPLRESGGFDESFTGWGYEDLELGYRLEKRFDLKVRHIAAPVVHRGERSASDWLARFREKGANALRLYLRHAAIREELQLEVDPVIENYSDPEFLPGDRMLAEIRESCEELEATGAWRDNPKFREMLTDFYRNLARHVERRAIRDALGRLLKTVTVVVVAKHGLRQVLKTFGSIIANRYPEELVRVIIYDPVGVPELADFFATYHPPVQLKFVHGDDAALKRVFRTGGVTDDHVLFIDDTLRAARHWLLFSCLGHAGGVEKVRGAVLPDTPLGRYLTERRLYVADAAVETRNINVSFTRRALVDKLDDEVVADRSLDLIALREVPGMLARYLVEPLRLYRMALARRAGPRRTGTLGRFLLSLPKTLTHMARLKARGLSVEDALLFPLFDKIDHYVRFVKG